MDKNMLLGSTQDTSALTINQAQELLDQLKGALGEAVVIQAEALDLILVALLGQGHLLLEDVPGVGKTLVAKALAKAVSASFKRIQCTPDILPSDITGVSIYNQKTQNFVFMPGPLFAQFVLVDEINRATPRTQSSLLESMAETQVSVDGQTHKLESPFFLIATQNPVETAGTFPLPEAQLDRFLVSLSLGYPDFEAELLILDREEHQSPLNSLNPVLSPDHILALQALVRKVKVSRLIKTYIIQLVSATRSHQDILLGVSPRGGVALQRAAQVMALIQKRDFVTPDDVKKVAIGVLAHRLISIEGSRALERQIVQNLLDTLPIPVV